MQEIVKHFGELYIDFTAHRLVRNYQEVPLTRTEWALLEQLVRNAGVTLTHRMLLQRVWGDRYGEESEYLRVYIGRLRRKLEDNPSQPHYILTVPGLGYRFVPLETPGIPSANVSPDSALPLTYPAPPTNLPVPMNQLIGREQEISTVCAFLRRSDVRLLTLTGVGGSGKTRLALQVAADLLNEFADGVFFVALAPIKDPALIASTIAQTLSVKEIGNSLLSEHLKEYLHTKALLLVLDNFEQVVVAGTLIAELLVAAPQLKVLVTSRAVLHLSAEQRFEVPSLALPDTSLPLVPDNLAESPAIALFITRARAIKPDFTLTIENALAVTEICRQLDGLPLAIELAAAWTRVLSPQALLSRLGSRLEFLTGGARDLPPRHQTLRAAIDWTYHLLMAQEQRLFAQLSVFVSGCTLAAVEAVVEPIGDSANTTRNFSTQHLLEALAALLDQSLLRQEVDHDGTPYFVMLETLREYALELLSTSEESEPVRRRHARYYLALAETAEPALKGPEQQHWLDQLDRAHDNMRAALDWAVEREEAEIALRLSGALWWFWVMHTSFSEGQRWIAQALALPGDVPLAVRAKALHGAGGLAWAQGDYTSATTSFEASLVLRRTLADKRGAASALNNLGLVAIAQGDNKRALTFFEENLHLFRELEDQRGIATSLSNLGWAAMECADYVRADESFRESLHLRQVLQDQWGIAASLTNLGWVALRRGTLEDAESSFKEGLGLWRILDDKASMAECLEGLVGLLSARGQAAQAAQIAGAAAAVRDLAGAPMTPAYRVTYEGIISVARAQLNPETWAAAWIYGQELPLAHLIAAILDSQS